VQLSDARQGDAAGPSADDTATRSLGDALRITYRVLQVFMVVIFALYFLSGLRQINANERGVNLLFGKIIGADLQPGFQFSYPAPMGELIKIPIGNEQMSLRKEFFVNLSETEERRIETDPTAEQTLAGGGIDSLDPDADGMLLLGDGSIAHARVELTYKRSNPERFIKNIAPEHERQIVAAAVRRGVVQAAACVTIEEFIKNTLTTSALKKDAGTFDEAAKQAAQRILDDDHTSSGIKISEFALKYRIPPRRVMTSFIKVNSASTEAGKAVNDAKQYRKTQLLELAGDAAELILAQIDDYENLIALGDQEKAGRTLATIDKILMGEEVTIDGKVYPPNITGQVTSIIGEARQYRTSMSNRAQADLAIFNAKRETFRANPRVMISGEWASAFTEFLTRPSVQSLYLPPGSDRVIVQINRDPDIARQQVKERYQKELEEANRINQQNVERARFQQKIDAETKSAQ
jgi:regulator of protease activity HflC (stomatin/prohibitin superfamily)